MEPSWIGRRISVRRVIAYTADGRAQYSDVVGDLMALDDRTAVVAARAGLVEINLDSVTIASPAPPSTADELALQAVAAAGWRAEETAKLGGWLMRATGGFGDRANSVLPLSGPGMPLDDALQHASAWYAERGLPLRLLVPSEARRLLDAALSERGWRVDYAVHTMAGLLDTLANYRPSGLPVDIAAAPDDAWLSRYRDGGGAHPFARRLLTRHDSVAFASIRDGDQVLAIGRATVDDGWLGITAVEVAPAWRRAGLANTVLGGLWRWGLDHGATRSYLQVRADNEGALELFRLLGYWVHHDYRYRLAPAAGV